MRLIYHCLKKEKMKWWHFYFMVVALPTQHTHTHTHPCFDFRCVYILYIFGDWTHAHITRTTQIVRKGDFHFGKHLPVNEWNSKEQTLDYGLSQCAAASNRFVRSFVSNLDRFKNVNKYVIDKRNEISAGILKLPFRTISSASNFFTDSKLG